MSALAAIATGFGIGVLMAIPLCVARRNEIARNFHKLFGSFEGKKGQERSKSSADSPSAASGGRLEGISPGIALFGIAAATVTTFYGVLSGHVIFIVSGIFAMTSVLLALIVSRAARN